VYARNHYYRQQAASKTANKHEPRFFLIILN